MGGIYCCIDHSWPTRVAARPKAWVCGRSLAGIVGLNPAGAWKSIPCERCVMSGRGLCVGLITRPEESYRVGCVCLSVIVKPWLWGGPGPLVGCWVMKREILQLWSVLCRLWKWWGQALLALITLMVHPRCLIKYKFMFQSFNATLHSVRSSLHVSSVKDQSSSGLITRILIQNIHVAVKSPILYSCNQTWWLLIILSPNMYPHSYWQYLCVDSIQYSFIFTNTSSVWYLKLPSDMTYFILWHESPINFIT